MQSNDNSPQIDEDVWQAWLKKNKTQDRLRYERRSKVIILVAISLIVGVLLWKLIA